MIIRTMRISEVPPMYLRANNRKLQAITVKETIQNFIRSSRKCIEVIDDEGLWANSNNFRRSFQHYVDYHGYRKSIEVTIRGNRVFLIKKCLR